MEKYHEKLIKWAIASMGLMSMFASLFLIFTPIVGATPSAYAQCGSDSYVYCSGGTRCTSTDDDGCKCYDANGRVVSRHSCKYASADVDVALEENDQ